MRLAERQASALSRKWGRWLPEFEPKYDALRPEEWVARKNPALAERALTGGDLAASIIAECGPGDTTFPSEVDLARCCGASRPAICAAIAKLVLAGYARRIRRGNANAIRVETGG